MLTIFINNESFQVLSGLSVAAAMQQMDRAITRYSVTGDARTPFCGMGICQECRVLINGQRCLACQTQVEANMRIETTDNREPQHD